MLNILDFLELLDPFWDYVKKIVSWTLVGYLFWHLSPTRVLFGHRRKWLDLSVIFACFAMILNDLLQYFTIMRGVMVAKAYEYLVFSPAPAGAVADVAVRSVSESAWNSLALSFIPDVSARLMELAPFLTMSREYATVLFERSGQEILFSAYPQGLNGALLQFYNSVVPLANIIQEYALLFGVALLLLIAVFVTLRLPIKRKSFVGLLDEGEARGKGIPLRFIVVFLALLFFSLFVFNLVMEWLAVAIDAPILMVALAVSVLLLTHHAHFSVGAWADWVTSFGTNFIEPFTRLFYRRSTVLLGVSGLLVLHLLTEIGNFLLPFVAPMRDSLYLSQLGPGHDNVFALAIHEFSGSLFADTSLVLVTALVVLAWFLLLAMPGYIWYKIFRLRHENNARHHPRFAPWLLALYYASLPIAFLVPLITFRRLEHTGLVGVDFFTRSFSASGALVSAQQALLLALIIFVVVFVLGQFSIRRFLYVVPLLASIVFMGFYVFYFFMSSFAYYLYAGLGAFVLGSPVLGVVLFLFLFLTIVFYISGYCFFLYEIIRD